MPAGTQVVLTFVQLLPAFCFFKKERKKVIISQVLLEANASIIPCYADGF